VATGGGDRTARVWDPVSGKQLAKPMPHQRRVVRVAFSPDSRRLATASFDRTAQLWDTASGDPVLKEPLQHAGPVFDVAFNEKGDRVVTSSGDNTARVWDAVTGVPRLPALWHTRHTVPNNSDTPVNASASGSAYCVMPARADSNKARRQNAMITTMNS
jgi:WD40 repeat protein